MRVLSVSALCILLVVSARAPSLAAGTVRVQSEPGAAKASRFVRSLRRGAGVVTLLGAAAFMGAVTADTCVSQGLEQAKPLGRAAAVALHTEQLRSQGIPEIQRRCWATPFDQHLSEWMHRVTPFGRMEFEQRVYGALLSEGDPRPVRFTHPRNDLWAAYLGLPPQGTLSISDHLPPQLQDQPDALVFKVNNDAKAHESLANTMVRLQLGKRRPIYGRFAKVVGINEDAFFTKDADGRDRTVLWDFFFRTPNHLIDAADKNWQPVPSHVRRLWTDADKSGRTLYRYAGSLGNFTVYMGSDQKGDYVEYVDRWAVSGRITEDTSRWVNRGMNLARILAKVHPDLKRLVDRVADIGLPKKHEDVIVHDYYGKPVWVSDRIHYDMERVKATIELENRLLGFSADNFLMEGSHWSYSHESSIAMYRQWLYENLPEGPDRAELEALDPFYVRK